MQTHELALVRGKAHFETLIHRANDAVDPGQPWRLEHVLELRSTGYTSPIYWRWCRLAYVTAWDATTLG